MKTSTYEESAGSGTEMDTGPIVRDGIGPRIEQVAELVGGKRFLANEIGVHETQLYRYIKGANLPSVVVAAAIAAAGRVTLDWLVSGEGPMRREALRATDIQEGAYLGKADEFVYVTRLRAVADENSEAQIVDSRYAFRADWIREKGWDTRKLTMDHARDGAMRPNIRPGDLLLLEAYHHQDGKRPVPGLPAGSFPPEDGVYKISLNDAIAIRRLQSDMTGGVFVSADANEGMGGRLVPGEQTGFRILARVLWAGHVIE